MAETTTTTSPPTTSPTVTTDPILGRLQKHIDTLKEKNIKLAGDNARLKAALAEQKASNSRVRKIPKKATPADASASSEAPATE